MEFVRNIHKLNQMKTARLAQLEEKNQIIDRVLSYRSECPQTLISFYVVLTRINLHHSRRSYESSLLETINMIPGILAENDRVNKLTLESLSSTDPCKSLAKLVSALDLE